MSFIFTIASISSLASIIWYNLSLREENIITSSTTWLIWFLISAVNFYLTFSLNKDLLSTLPYLYTTLGMLGIFLMNLRKNQGKSAITKNEITIILLCALSFFLSMTLKSKILSYLCLQLCYIIGYFPLMTKLKNKEANEPLTPWILGFMTYLFVSIGIISQSNNQVLLIHSLGYGLIGHFAVIYLSVKDKTGFKKMERVT